MILLIGRLISVNLPAPLINSSSQLPSVLSLPSVLIFLIFLGSCSLMGAAPSAFLSANNTLIGLATVGDLSRLFLDEVSRIFGAGGGCAAAAGALASPSTIISVCSSSSSST